MIPSLLIGAETHRDLSQLLKAKRRLTLSGASNDTAKALLLGSILHHTPQSSILITEREEEVESLAHWVHFFGFDPIILPLFSSEDSEDVSSKIELLLKCQHLESHQIVLTTEEAYLQHLPSHQELLDQSVVISCGQKIEFTEFVEGLLERGYKHGEDLYIHPGEYRRTGDSIDIFPIQASHPFRISLDDEKIEKIFAVDKDNLSNIEDYNEDLTIIPLQFTKTLPLKDQIPADHLLVINDLDHLEPPTKYNHLRFTSFPESEDGHVHLRYLSVLKFYTLTDFLNDLRDKLQQHWSLVIVSKRHKELSEIFAEEHIPHTTEAKRREGAITLLPHNEDEVLPHSIQNPDLQCALLTDREIFSLKKTQKQKGIQKLALDFITSLSPGDFVVHMDHGIGLFEGMTQKEVSEVTREYLDLTYAESDKLFVPVHQADKLSKFVYEEGNEPLLTRLGTSEWKKVMSKAKKETEKIAKELLELYAKRAKTKGHTYPEDSDVQKKFDAAFPYQETPGQLKAIEDIKHDMEDPHPMDRLVCGDVGFGKTEVAMRAAFKAVQGGKQVAVVAPITILVDQHYQNFCKRMEGFNIRIAMLSRFKSAKEQKEILEQVRKGDVDIVIGTHRLLQPDVDFFNLGLVVIDEEQRFGVKQKERLKEMRANVDILTLTATPIPRTLNLGLHKLRDITTITTPPPGRLPIITEVRKFSDELIRKAILTEKEREGQAYVLHNRVETIDAFANKLRELIPECKFIVAHGQLKPEELEKRILQFKEGEFDILVSSTIIENGIDLPRANTLIVNAAENFGLSQLYQLRGRVGRGKLQAYAYFLYHGQKLKDDARKRLRAIVEACELGSGFQVAMRDLEIRGAGEILGASQAGNMQTIGVSHYLRMLKSAVEELKQGGSADDLQEDVTTEIQLPVEAMIPSFYITDAQEKIAMYQKLAGSENEDILQEFEQDLREEFGEPPSQVQALFAILRLKMACQKAGVTRVKLDEDMRGKQEIVLALSERITAQEIMQLLQVNPQWKISGSTLRVGLNVLQSTSGNSELQWLQELKNQVRALLKKKASKKKEKKNSE